MVMLLTKNRPTSRINVEIFKKRQKILQTNWSFVFHFMFSLDKYALL